MKKLVLALSLVVVGAVSIYALTDAEVDSEQPRSPASIPANYDSMKAAEKQDVLWSEVRASAYTKGMPAYRKFGLPQLIGMGVQEIETKGKRYSDFAPNGWKKYLHRRGAIAKVKIVSKSGHKYSGIFQGAENALLRLSLTYKVEGDRPVAPGLALKVLRDGTYSANISALVSLNGQGKDFNFFSNSMSNIVPMGSGIGQSLVHEIFDNVSRYPEELMTQDMAAIDAQGLKIQSVVSPRQLFFVPSSSLNFAKESHDVREDFLQIPEGTVIYEIRAVADKYAQYNYAKNYRSSDVATFLRESTHIADIVTTSEFIASEFGDDGIFFRHQIHPR